MRGKLFAWVSWIIFLVSAVAEWGFDVDFPLTALVCLAMATAAFFAAGMQVQAIRPRRSDNYDLGASFCRPHGATAVSHSAYPLGYSDVRSQFDDSSRSDWQSILDLPSGFRVAMSPQDGIVCEVVVTMETAVLRPETERGPPRGENQVRDHLTAYRADRPGAGGSPAFLMVAPLLVQLEPATPFKDNQT